MRSLKFFPYLFLVFLFLVTCKNESNDSSESNKTEAKEEKLGIVDIQFTGEETAMPHFKRGLLLLHNFEYEDALTAFEEATALDSTQVLTHWGEAMCHYKALWKL